MEQINYGREAAYLRYLLRYLLILGGKMHTVEDILALPEGERAELIDGEMFLMAAPTWTHQEILGWLHIEIAMHIRSNNGKCRVIMAPFGVFIKRDNKNYLEPDISVICNRDRLDEKGCHGAPDWVIEIVSPSSKDMDYKRKRIVYQEAGVREYWIIDPLQETVTIYHFETGEEAARYRFTDKVKSGVLEGLEIDFSDRKRYLE